MLTVDSHSHCSCLLSVDGAISRSRSRRSEAEKASSRGFTIGNASVVRFAMYVLRLFRVARLTSVQKPFTEKEFYVYDEKPLCGYHYHEANGSLCRACGEGIEGPCGKRNFV